ncbi:DNA repair protein RadA [bacterium]|nr:DNA repair protein RadA [bacterium]
MAKIKSKWVCQACGYETAGYLGKCPECGQWGSFTEEIQNIVKPQNVSPQGIFNDIQPSLISDIHIGEEVRVSTNISEFDRILGGGLVQGSIVLIAGDPGIGKSTILLQTSGELAKKEQKILYVSAEESAGQLKLRANRLNVNESNLYIYPQTNLESIREQIDKLQPQTVIIDSIQAIYSGSITSSAGSVSQIRECCNILMQIAKTKNITMLIIGHVTKDGNIAGPKVLEHMVDTVISFEGDKYKSYRILRSIKNRFGNTAEVGIFEMGPNGLVEVLNPNQLFLNERSQDTIPGSAIIVTNEGTRPLLVEIQALVGTTPYPTPRRVTNGVDISRLLQILAVLEKRVGLNLSKQDVYINVMGGIEVDEPSADLGIALAIATCARDVVVDPQTVIIGEIGLSGEIHPVSNLEKRLNEAAVSGFKKAIIPYANRDVKHEKIKTVPVKRLIDAISACISPGVSV